MKQLKTLFTAMLCTAVVAAFSQNKTELNKPVFKAGQKFQTSNIVKTTSKMEMMGQEMETKADVAITRLFEIKKQNGNLYNVAATITKMATTAEMMGQSMSYDSDKKEDAGTEIGKLLKDKINVPADMEMNDEGKITPLKKEKKDSADAGGIAAMMESMGAGADETALTDDMFINIPKNLKAGDTWSDSIIAEGTKTYRDYTVKSLEGSDAVLTISGKQTLDKKMETNGMEMTMLMESKLTGEMTADTSTGVIKQRLLVSEGSGNLEMMGQQVPMTTKVETTSTTMSL